MKYVTFTNGEVVIITKKACRCKDEKNYTFYQCAKLSFIR